MLTRTQRRLVEELRDRGVPIDSTEIVIVALDTPETRAQMLDWVLANPEAETSDILQKVVDLTAEDEPITI